MYGLKYNLEVQIIQYFVYILLTMKKAHIHLTYSKFTIDCINFSSLYHIIDY